METTKEDFFRNENYINISHKLQNNNMFLSWKLNAMTSIYHDQKIGQKIRDSQTQTFIQVLGSSSVIHEHLKHENNMN